MIQTWWWSRFYDDIVMMIQQWWSSSRDDLDPVMKKTWRRRWIRRRIEDEDDLKMKKTWRWWWLEDEEDLNMKMMIWSSWYREEYQCWKLCRKNTFLVKRECWCICNLGMYSLVYLMSYTPMFIPGSVCNVFESCHSPMFLSRGSIM